MCRYCDMLKTFKENDGTMPSWSTTSNISAMWGFTPLPEQKEEEETPELDLSGLSDEARDVIGLIRCNARAGFANTLDRAHIVPCCLRHGVKPTEVKRVLELSEQIKTAEARKKNKSSIVEALINAILES